MQRYRQINIILHHEKPSSIIEVGTWNGNRALVMAEASGARKYYGFDLFETADKVSDEKEMNVKPHNDMLDVYQKLGNSGKFDEARLFRGDSRRSLKEFYEVHGDDFVDFAFIDGGHSVETIQSDFDYCRKLVKPGKYIIFDDFYSQMPEGFDYERFGANKVIENLECTIFPSRDEVKGGGVVHIVAYRNMK